MILARHPRVVHASFRPEYDAIEWAQAPELQQAWCEARTGYPIVDAAMRQLHQTGYMHNRVRMIVGSFLVKNLLLHWQQGEKWFWEQLLDADRANNSFGWQWVAGCGTDAQPFFRIFNPVEQSKKFDPDGHYIRAWVPELAQLSNKDLHAPWQVSPLVLHTAGIVLGKNYALPIVDHRLKRLEALSLYKNIKLAV